MHSETNPMIRLYQNHGSAIGYWEGWVEFDGTVFIRYAKKLDGKPVVKQYQAQGKNIGKANETTPQQQGVLELESKARLKLDKGYVKTVDEARAPSTNTLGLLKPMLATPIEKVKSEKIDWEDAYVQPKLDGHRALFKDGTLYSRQGKELDLPHIVEAIHAMGLSDLHLDGELYLHGKTLQELSKLIKKHRPETLDLQYHIYDQVLQKPFRERILDLADYFSAERNNHPNLVAVPTRQSTSLENTMLFHTTYRDQGYEGTMLRFGSDPYLHGKRARTLLKLKEFHDEEFRIIGVNEGKPYIKGDSIYRVPVWVCETPEGKEFTVTAQGDMHEKDALWKQRAIHIHKKLTVKFHYLSADGIPQLPVALRFHETV